ncbi:Comt [Symbiodinium natans]|uniref:catechol O-methyltransferase n=1 Tax=Symbiodinium natans TaxID=878477 RepID=A0A812IJX9_9DINO|nr:Comt [Symbiodinium natans]
MDPTEQLRLAVRNAEQLAATLRQGRRPREVTVDPQVATCATEIRQSILLMKQPVSTAVAGDLVAGLSAFAKMRILHADMLNNLKDLPRKTWMDMSAPVVVEAVTSYAQFQLEDPDFNQFLSDLLVSRGVRRMGAAKLANLAYAAATLNLGAFEGVHALFSDAFAAAAEAELGRLGTFDLSRALWSLARLAPEVYESAPPCASRLSDALLRQRKLPFGYSLGQVLWAMPRLGLDSDILWRRVQKTAGKEAFAEKLRQAKDAPTQVELLRGLAENVEAAGLQAAVLNAAVLRAMAVRDEGASAEEILELMALRGLWTPVTYRLAARLGSSIKGSPPAPGLTQPGQRAHKYVRALYHALARAKPGDAASAAAALESFSRSSKRAWLKFGAADEKGVVLEEAWRSLGQSQGSGSSKGSGKGSSKGKPSKVGRPLLALEFGTFLGYSAAKMVRQLGAGSRVISFEMDPEVACLAMNFIEIAGLSDVIDVRIGQCEDLVQDLKAELDPESVDAVYMDHNQMTYHADLSQLQESGLLSKEVLFAATQALKPGAPLLLWHLKEAQKADVFSELDIVSSPDCGFKEMEDWTVLARATRAKTRSLKRRVSTSRPPRELVLLAAECNLMRWRTAQGMVDEARWNEFVQYVREGMEKFAGITSTRDYWPQPQRRDAARKHTYERLDY